MNIPTNDNEILRYYEAEMRYLREAGKEFAQAFPDRARRCSTSTASASAIRTSSGCSKALRF
jgi:hypothetical protein